MRSFTLPLRPYDIPYTCKYYVNMETRSSVKCKYVNGFFFLSQKIKGEHDLRTTFWQITTQNIQKIQNIMQTHKRI